MTNIVNQEWQKILDNIVLPKRVFKLNSDNHFTLKDKTVSFKNVEELDQDLLEIMKGYIEVDFNPGSQSLSAEAKWSNTPNDKVYEVITDYMRRNIGGANPTLTKLYRYYSHKRSSTVSKDLWELFKYIRSHGDQGEQHKKNILGILKIIMERGE